MSSTYKIRWPQLHTAIVIGLRRRVIIRRWVRLFILPPPVFVARQYHVTQRPCVWLVCVSVEQRKRISPEPEPVHFSLRYMSSKQSLRNVFLQKTMPVTAHTSSTGLESYQERSVVMRRVSGLAGLQSLPGTVL